MPARLPRVLPVFAMLTALTLSPLMAYASDEAGPLPPPGSGQADPIHTVPEPDSLVLVGLALLAAQARRRLTVRRASAASDDMRA
jgi:hypothetical protein